MRTLFFLSFCIGLLSTSIAQVPLDIDSEGVLRKSDYDALIKKHSLQALSSYDTLCDNPLAVRALFIKDDKYGLINEYGEMVTKYLYDWIGWVFNGHRGSQSLVMRDYNRYGIIDAKGIEILPCQYIRIRPSSSDSVFAVIQDGDDWVPNNAINDPSWKYIQVHSDGSISDYLPKKIKKLSSTLPLVISSAVPKESTEPLSEDEKEYFRRKERKKIKENKVLKSSGRRNKVTFGYLSSNREDTITRAIRTWGKNKLMKPKKYRDYFSGEEWWHFDVVTIYNSEWVVFTSEEDKETGNDPQGVYSISQNRVIVQPKYDRIEFKDYGILAYFYPTVRRKNLRELDCYDFNGNLKINHNYCSYQTEFYNNYIPSHDIDILGNFLYVYEFDTLSFGTRDESFLTYIYDSAYNKVLTFPLKNYYDVSSYYNDKLWAIAQNSEGKFGVFDLNGKIILDFEFDIIEEDFSIWKGDRCFKTKKDDQVSFFDYTGDLVFESTYSEIIEINKGTGREDWCLSRYYERGRNMFYYEVDNKWGLLDSSLNVLIPAIYDKIGCADFEDGLMYVQQEDRIGVFNFNTDSFAIPMVYSKIAKVENGLWYLYKKSLVGLYDLATDSFVLPIEYEKITYGKEGYAVTKDSKYAFLDFDTQIRVGYNNSHEIGLQKIYKGLWLGTRSCLDNYGQGYILMDSKFLLNSFGDIIEVPKAFKLPGSNNYR